MDVQKITTSVTAAAVIGTGATIGGGQVIDNYKGGPEKRANAEEVRPVSYTHLTLPTNREV